VDEAARRDHRLDAELVELRALLELAAAHELQARELHGEHAEGEDDDEAQQVELELQLGLRVVRLGVLRAPAAAARSGQKSHQPIPSRRAPLSMRAAASSRRASRIASTHRPAA